CARQAPVGRPGLVRQGRDRDPADHEPHADVRPQARRRRARRPLPQGSQGRARVLGRSRVLVDLVPLTVVLNEIEADQVQSLLKFENIESMQRPTNTGAGSIGGSGAMSGSREILVKPEDLETAKAIIGEE